MGKRSVKNHRYFSLLFRNKQDLNRYNSTTSIEKQVLHILEQVVKKEGQKVNYSLLDTVLQYLPGQVYPSKAKEHIEEKEEESTLEAELEEPAEAPEKEVKDFIPVRYLPLDNNLMQDFAYGGKAAHDSLYGSIASLLPKDEEYEPPISANDNYDAGPSADEEARKELQESKYEFIVPSVDIDHEQQQKLALWIQFNPALFAFLESFYGLSRDVDYKAVA